MLTASTTNECAETVYRCQFKAIHMYILGVGVYIGVGSNVYSK